MALKGTAFMVMWHDIDAAGEAAYNEWHTVQHMPERLAHPGFLRGRRGVHSANQNQKYFTLYESENLESLRSNEYLKSLNNPTEWTGRIAPSFRNFLRVACETVSSTGIGVGGAILTYRVSFNRVSALGDVDQLQRDLGKLAGVCGVHIALPRPQYSDIATTETKIRPKMSEKTFDALVMLDGIGVAELDAINAMGASLLAAHGIDIIRADNYALAFLLGRDGLS